MAINHIDVSFLDRVISAVVSHIQRLLRSAQTIQARRNLSRFKSCGVGAGIWGRATITAPENIEVGDNVHIGDNAFIRAEGGLVIGANTHISRNLVLYTMNHDYDGDRLPYDHRIQKKPVRIGRNVWIGMNVCIAPGSVIGDGAVIALGTVVSGEVPPLSVIGGEKWRLLGKRDEENYKIKDENKAYGGPDGVLFVK